eukprot:scaffold398_cov305-Prasinococcus_capsulatus_cf.AAC.10
MPRRPDAQSPRALAAALSRCCPFRTSTRQAAGLAVGASIHGRGDAGTRVSRAFPGTVTSARAPLTNCPWTRFRASVQQARGAGRWLACAQRAGLLPPQCAAAAVPLGILPRAHGLAGPSLRVGKRPARCDHAHRASWERHGTPL